ncbi:MAG: type II toxin-antitoxin system VapC family toxin [Sphingomonas sp.]|uniref:type II toxin-antitoxin system VapC family toxin n=1 Tax=Sphingomonas sp. TaxID=28214 RepID=UPI002276A3E1|nr:type II toxin-antitoxin system VapC family toxin [Sphingomonas sp.]MCX8474323.1 type II toxin-antitoxin system VapC family toxin [Sphingomonas sp.]
MIAVDTNIVLRLILGDDESQLGAVRKLMADDSLFVSLTVLLETGWVLESRCRMPRPAVADALIALTLLEGIQVPRSETVLRLLERYRAGADLADMIHLASAAKLEAFATFDRRLHRDADGASLLKIETPA